jgi:hypothetical protein
LVVYDSARGVLAFGIFRLRKLLVTRRFRDQNGEWQTKESSPKFYFLSLVLILGFNAFAIWMLVSQNCCDREIQFELTAHGLGRFANRRLTTWLRGRDALPGAAQSFARAIEQHTRLLTCSDE